MVSKHAKAVWIERIILIVGKADEKEKKCTSFIKISVSCMTNLGRN